MFTADTITTAPKIQNRESWKRYHPMSFRNQKEAIAITPPGAPPSTTSLVIATSTACDRIVQLKNALKGESFCLTLMNKPSSYSGNLEKDEQPDIGWLKCDPNDNKQLFIHKEWRFCSLINKKCLQMHKKEGQLDDWIVLLSSYSATSTDQQWVMSGWSLVLLKNKNMPDFYLGVGSPSQLNNL